MKTNQKKAYIYALIAVLFWSTAASAFKLSLNYIDYINLLTFSSLISVIVYSAILSVQNKWVLIKQVKFKDIIKSAFIGFLNPFLYYFILFQAYMLLLAQEAMTINYLWPIVLVLLSIPFLKQKITVKSLIAVIVSFMGTYIIATGGNILGFKFTSTIGVLLAIMSTLIWAMFWLFNIRDTREEVSKMFLNFCFGFIYIFIYSVFFGKIEIPNLNVLFFVAYIGVFEMGITFVIWLKALKLSETTAKVSNLIYIAPFLSLIFINLVIGETIRIYTFIGLLLIIIGIIIQKYSFSKKK